MATTLSPPETADPVDDLPNPASAGGGRRRGRLPRRATQKMPRPPRVRAPFKWTTGSLAAIGLMLVVGMVALFGLFLFLGSALSANRAQDVMFRDMKTSLAQATVPVNGGIATGTPIGIVKIPAIGLEQVFVEGSSSDQTMHGPGLRHDTALPGQAGASVLVGHRATFGAAFADLDRLKVGDKIEVVTGQGTFTYVIDLVRTSDAKPTQIQQAASRLTLVTSDPALTPTRDLQVSAQLQGDPLPTTTVSTAQAADVPGQGSSDRSVALLLWAQMLLLVTVAVTWAAAKLRNPLALWIGAVPVLLALLWNVFSNLAVLLPNTL